MSSTVGRLVVDVLTNQSGGAVAYGDVVIIDTAHDSAFTTTTSGAYVGMLGVCIELNGIANGSSGRIQLEGHCAQVNLNASGTRGHFIKTFTVAKQATDGGASRVVGAFGQILVTGTTPPVELFGFPDAASSSAAAGTPGLTLSTTNSAGAASTFVATDATVAAFDSTVPVTQALGDTAATGSAGFAARRDHKHGMPASGLAQSYIGYNTVGGSSETMTQWKVYTKAITTTGAGLLASIGLHVKGAASSAENLRVGLYADNAGTPGDLIAANGSTPGTAGLYLENALGSAGNLRWLHFPIGYWLAASTTYYLAVQSGSSALVTIAYDTSGSDKVWTVTIDDMSDGGTAFAISDSTKKYSIRGNFIG